MAFGFNSNDNAYEPLKLMQCVILKSNEVCLRYLDNSMLCSLPAPGYHLYKTSTHAFKNSRRRMEDRHVIIHDLNTMFNDQEASPSSYYAVFDGHAGHDAAAYSVAHLHQFLAESEHYAANPERALTDAFHKTDMLFLQKCKVESLVGGTTAICALLRPKEKCLYIAWCGDSKALIANQGRIIQCVNPHKPSREDEKARIENGGGTVIYFGTWRVAGQLAVSRAIGDMEYKPHVIATPDIHKIPLDGAEDFLIIACDGLWDYVSDDLAAETVYDSILTEKTEDIDHIAQRLSRLSKLQGSTDNITVIVVYLRDPAKIAADAKWMRTATNNTQHNSIQPPSPTAHVLTSNPLFSDVMDTTSAGGGHLVDTVNNASSYTAENILAGDGVGGGFLLDLDSGYQQQQLTGKTTMLESPDNDFYMQECKEQLPITNGKSAPEVDSCDDEPIAAVPFAHKDLDEEKDEADFQAENQPEVVMSPTLMVAKAIAEGTGVNNNDDQQDQHDEEDDEDVAMDEDFLGVGGVEKQEQEEEKVREITPTPGAVESQQDVHGSNLLDNVADSGEESEDEWNYFEGNTAAVVDKENVDPVKKTIELVEATVAAAAAAVSSPPLTPATLVINEDELDDDTMSQLNPNAAEFVPISPTRNTSSPTSCVSPPLTLCSALINEDAVIAQSPKRSTPEENTLIDNLPKKIDFLSEVKSRPSEVYTNGHEVIDQSPTSQQESMENLLNGKNLDDIEFQPTTPTKTIAASSDEFHFGPNATPFSTPSKVHDQSEAFSTKANYGDESVGSLPGNNTSNNPFSDEVEDQTDFKTMLLNNKESDPMSMSFYQEKEDVSNNPFDLNAVQDLPDNLEEFLGEDEREVVEKVDLEIGVCELQQKVEELTLEPTKFEENFVEHKDAFEEQKDAFEDHKEEFVEHKEEFVEQNDAFEEHKDDFEQHKEDFVEQHVEEEFTAVNKENLIENDEKLFEKELVETPEKEENAFIQVIDNDQQIPVEQFEETPKLVEDSQVESLLPAAAQIPQEFVSSYTESTQDSYSADSSPVCEIAKPVTEDFIQNKSEEFTQKSEEFIQNKSEEFLQNNSEEFIQNKPEEEIEDICVMRQDLTTNLVECNFEPKIIETENQFSFQAPEEPPKQQQDVDTPTSEILQTIIERQVVEEETKVIMDESSPLLACDVSTFLPPQEVVTLAEEVVEKERELELESPMEEDVTSSVKDDVSPVQSPIVELDIKVEQIIAPEQLPTPTVETLVTPSDESAADQIAGVIAATATVAAVTAAAIPLIAAEKTEKTATPSKPAAARKPAVKSATPKTASTLNKLTGNKLSSASKPLLAEKKSSLTSATKTTSSKPTTTTATKLTPKTSGKTKTTTSAVTAAPRTKLSAGASSTTKATTVEKKPAPISRMNGGDKSSSGASSLPMKTSTVPARKPITAVRDSLPKTTTVTSSARTTLTKTTATTARPATAPITKTTTTTSARTSGTGGATTAAARARPTSGTAAAPRTTTTTSSSTRMLSSTTAKPTKSSTLSSVNKTTSSTTAKRDVAPLAKPRVPISKATATSKGPPDTEKQNKENVNKLTASRTRTTALTNGKTTTTTTMAARKMATETKGGVKSTTKTSTTTTTTTTGSTTNRPPIKRPTPATTTTTTTTENSRTITNNKPTKITGNKTSTKPLENGDVITNGVATIEQQQHVEQKIVEQQQQFTDIVEDSLIIKDISPVLDNSQLFNAD